MMEAEKKKKNMAKKKEDKISKKNKIKKHWKAKMWKILMIYWNSFISV